VSPHGRRRSTTFSPVALLAIGFALLGVLTAGTVSAAAAGDRLVGPLQDLAAGRDLPPAVRDTLIYAPDGRVVVEATFCNSVAAADANFAACGAQKQIRSDRRVQVALRPERLTDLATLPGVVQVAPPGRVIPCQFAPGFGPTVSEAVQTTNASALQAAGFDGTGCNIAIIDLGFGGLTAAEVNVNQTDPTALYSLRADGLTNFNRHGTAVAQQVQDMAPGAHLTLIAVDTPLSIEAAINAVAAGHFQIAVMGLTVIEGPFDGTHAITKAVANASAAGVLFIQAAGNFAQRHWSGTYSDTDADNIMEFRSGVEAMTFTLPVGMFQVDLSWYETAGATTNRDYDLVLKDNTGYVVAQSVIGQNGTEAPHEQLWANITAAGTYSLEIWRIPGHPVFADKFQLWIPDYDITPVTLQKPDSSLPIPAEAPTAFTIGAVRGTLNDATPYNNLTNPGRDVVEPFSSRGPALSGELKPNLMGPDGCRTSLAAVPTLEGGEWIAQQAYGTSFAAAHVAGAAALLYSENNTRTRDELLTALYRLAYTSLPPTKPLPLPNNTYGHGRVSLRMGVDVSKPTVLIASPANGETITTTQPTIIGTITDIGSGVDVSTIALAVDGTAVTGYSFDPTTGMLVYRVPTALARTAHQVSLSAADLAGNVSATTTVSFRVSPPTVTSGLHMFSIPYSFAGLSETVTRPSSIFGLPAEQIQIARWLPTDTTPGNKYHLYGGATGAEDVYASFVPQDTKEAPFVVASPPAGLGYFLNLPGDAVLNVAGTSLNDLLRYEIVLSYGYTQPRGWNMIGCPFPDAVDWGSVQMVTSGVRQDLSDAIAAGVTEGILFELKRKGNTYYYDFPSDPTSGTLKPWTGYWVHVLKDTKLVVYSSSVTTSAASKAAAPAAPADDQWQLQLCASAAGGVDPANFIGICGGATDGYDAGRDVPEPPALRSPVRLYMDRPDWGSAAAQYVRDVRGALGRGQSWDVSVECTEPGADVTISWPDLGSTVPADVVLTLTDASTGQSVYMRTCSAYTYRNGDAASVRQLRITASPAGSGALSVTGVTAAQAPDGSVRFSYTVSAAADVTADVLNIAGRAVGTIQGKTSGAGVQSLTWNGRGTSGTKVPAGRYLLRLTARTGDGQMAQSVRAFQVGR
jgi:hypothetical protein